MVTTKMTKREMFAEIIAIANEIERTDIIEFCEHEIELLNKKNTTKSDRKPSVRQVENEKIKDAIFEYLLNTGNTVRVSDIAEQVEECAGLGSQKITALMTQLSGGTKATGTEPVERIVEKKIAYYRARV